MVTKIGEPYVGRLPQIQRGVANIRFAVEQMRQMRKMGPLSQILEMLPGQLGQAAKQVDPRDIEKNFKQMEAIINSMTPYERAHHQAINGSRRKRIARGSGL